MNVQQYFRVPKGSVTPQGPDPDAFILTFALNANDSITLPLVAGGTYDFFVDKGTGEPLVHVTSHTDPNRILNYTGFPAGDYVLKLSGTCTHWQFGTVTTSRLKLKSVDQWGDVGALNYNAGFDGCSNLISVAPGVPANTIIGALFRGTTSLTSIPENLFASDSSNSKQFLRAFTNSGISSIPENLFQNQTGNNLSLQELFDNCDSITSIPENLFNGVSVSSFAFIFRNCNGITSIPANLFSTNISTTNFGEIFRGCSNITSIPTGLFDNNINATFFSFAFALTSISSVPAGLFDNNTLVTAFNGLFFSCTSLTSIPTGLFDNCPDVTNYMQLFDGCSSLTSIPSGLFDSNTEVTNFSYCFRNCSSLGSIPSGLFNNNTKVTTFLATFYGCSSITSVPSGLFNNTTLVTIFGENNSLRGVFSNCSNLVSIPSDLFDNTPLVVNYSRAFENCPNLNVNVSSLVFGMDMSKVTTTNQMFTGCTSLNGNGQDLIDKPKAAGYTIGTASNTGSYRTFFNCTSLTDFATIPAEYK